MSEIVLEPISAISKSLYFDLLALASSGYCYLALNSSSLFYSKINGMFAINCSSPPYLSTTSTLAYRRYYIIELLWFQIITYLSVWISSFFVKALLHKDLNSIFPQILIPLSYWINKLLLWKLATMTCLNNFLNIMLNVNFDLLLIFLIINNFEWKLRLDYYSRLSIFRSSYVIHSRNSTFSSTLIISSTEGLHCLLISCSDPFLKGYCFVLTYVMIVQIVDVGLLNDIRPHSLLLSF